MRAAIFEEAVAQGSSLRNLDCSCFDGVYVTPPPVEHRAKHGHFVLKHGHFPNQTRALPTQTRALPNQTRARSQVTEHVGAEYLDSLAVSRSADRGSDGCNESHLLQAHLLVDKVRVVV